MHRHYFQRLGLLTPATESTAQEATPGAATTPLAASPPAAITPPSTAKPGVIDNAIALFRDKGALTAEITTLKASNGSLIARVSQLETDLVTVTTERDTLKADFSRLESALAQATKEKTDVQTEVTHQLATANVPPAVLPKVVSKPGENGAAAGSIDEQIEDLNSRIEASTDSKEKGRLGQQVWDLMVQQSKSGK